MAVSITPFPATLALVLEVPLNVSIEDLTGVPSMIPMLQEETTGSEIGEVAIGHVVA